MTIPATAATHGPRRSVARLDERKTAHGSPMFVEVLECGHDGHAILPMLVRGHLDRRRYRRCWYCLTPDEMKLASHIMGAPHVCGALCPEDESDER